MGDCGSLWPAVDSEIPLLSLFLYLHGKAEMRIVASPLLFFNSGEKHRFLAGSSLAVAVSTK